MSCNAVALRVRPYVPSVKATHVRIRRGDIRKKLLHVYFLLIIFEITKSLNDQNFIRVKEANNTHITMTELKLVTLKKTSMFAIPD